MEQVLEPGHTVRAQPEIVHTNTLARRNLFRLGIGLWLLCLWGCGKPEQTYHVPGDATLVLSVNTRSLALKTALDLPKLINSSAFEQAREKADIPIGSNWEESVQESGLDLLSEVYVFSTAGISHTSSPPFTAVAAMGDTVRFRDFIRNQDPEARFSRKNGLTFYHNAAYSVGWNKKMAFISFDTLRSAEDRALKIISYAYLHPEESLYKTNKLFREVQEESYDVAGFINVGQLVKLNPTLSAAVSEEDGRNYLAGRLNFEQGQVRLDMDAELAGSAPDIIRKVFTKRVSSHMIDQFPVAQPTMLFAMNADLDSLYHVLNSLKMLTMTEVYLSFLGTNCLEFTKIFSGEFVLGALKNPKSGQTEVVAQLGIKSPKALRSFMGKLTNKEVLIKEGPYYISHYAEPEYSLFEKPKYLYFTSGLTGRQLMTEPPKHLKESKILASELGEGSLSAMMHFPSQGETGLASYTDSLLFRPGLMTHHFDRLFVSLNQTSWNTWKSSVRLKLKNKDLNSLIVLLKMAVERSESPKKLGGPTAHSSGLANLAQSGNPTPIPQP